MDDRKFIGQNHLFLPINGEIIKIGNREIVLVNKPKKARSVFGITLISAGLAAGMYYSTAIGTCKIDSMPVCKNYRDTTTLN